MEEPKKFSTFRERLYHLQVNFHHFCSAIILLSTSWIDDFFFFLYAFIHDSRGLKMIGFALVDLEYMAGASLHDKLFKKEIWYIL